MIHSPQDRRRNPERRRAVRRLEDQPMDDITVDERPIGDLEQVIEKGDVIDLTSLDISHDISA
jgi:hypothetical protein